MIKTDTKTFSETRGRTKTHQAMTTILEGVSHLFNIQDHELHEQLRKKT